MFDRDALAVSDPSVLVSMFSRIRHLWNVRLPPPEIRSGPLFAPDNFSPPLAPFRLRVLPTVFPTIRYELFIGRINWWPPKQPAFNFYQGQQGGPVIPFFYSVWWK